MLKQFVDQVKIRLISQSTNFQKFLKYFIGTTVLTIFVPLLPVLFTIFALDLNESLSLPSAGKSIASPSLFKAGSAP